MPYLVVPRLRWPPRLSQHRRLVQYAQPEPNEAPTSSRCTLVAKPGVFLLDCRIGKPRAAEPLVLPLVLGGLGARLLPHGALGAPPPRRTWRRRPRYSQENLARARASSPEIPGGAHGALPIQSRARVASNK
jgi:hypothetical protein